jgi:hypothetical protein
MNSRQLLRELRPGDIAILLVAVALLAGLWTGLAVEATSPDARREVVITRNSGPDFTLPAWTEQVISIDGPLGRTRIEIRNGQARIIESPCRQKLCILEGWLQHAGETAACVPNEVGVSLVAANSRLDAVNF